MGSYSYTPRHRMLNSGRSSEGARASRPHLGTMRPDAGETPTVHGLHWTRVPQLVQWMATLRCPLSCPHCLAASQNGGFPDMPLEKAEDLIDQVAEMGVHEFLLTGGEPVVREDLPEVIRYLGRRQVRWSLNTAAFPSAELRAAMEAVPPVFVAVSLDGPEQVHNRFRGSERAYAEAMEAIRYYAGLPQCRVAAGTTVTAFNFDALAETFPLVANSGAAEWGIHLPVREGRAETRDDLLLSRRQLRKLLRFVARKRNYFPVQMADEMSFCGEWEPLVRDEPLVCGAGRTHCVVLPDGEVVPCTTLDRSASVGSIHKTSLEQIWTEGFRDIRAWKPQHKCNACEYARACEGGCWLQRRKGSGCYKDVWQMPKMFRTAAGIAVCLAAFQGSASAEEVVVPEPRPVDEIDDLDIAPLKIEGVISVPLGVGGPGSWSHPRNSRVEDFVIRWYTRDFPAVRGPLDPLTIPQTLGNDPVVFYLKAVQEDRLPRETVALCQSIQACLKTGQCSLALSSLLWRNLSENLLDGKNPTDRTPEERAAIRETLRLLKLKTVEWRKKIFSEKLAVHLAAKGRFGGGGGGAFGSKAGPRPRPYHIGLAWDAVSERWGRVGADKSAVQDFLKLHPYAQEYRLQITLPEGAEWEDGAPRSRSMDIFDVCALKVTVPGPVTVNVVWDARYHKGRSEDLYWTGKLQLPSNVELTYVDVLRCAKGVMRDWKKELAQLDKGPMRRSRREGYFSYIPLNPLFLADIRQRCDFSGMVPAKEKRAKRIEALIVQLGDDEYEVRAQAQAELLSMGGPDVRAALYRNREHEDPETRARVLSIMKEIGRSTAVLDEQRLLATWLTDFWML